MNVSVSRHATRQAYERCGISEYALTVYVWTLVSQGHVYRPLPKNAKDANEFWVAVRGPKGDGTAVCIPLGKAVRVITVRDARQFTQGERAGEALVYKPFRVLGDK